MEKNRPILDGIDPEIVDRLVSRREAIRKGATASAALAWGLKLGSVPIALGALTKEAFGQAPSVVLEVLNFAYILEHLENELYKAVLGTSAVAAQNNAFAPVRNAVLALGAPGADVVAALTLIQQHEAAHVELLRTTINSLGGNAPTITANDFDFTGGNGAGNGPFARATSEVDFLLLVAQAVEDTGVRAYKGQAPRLLVDNNATADTVLETALRIHSVEARHASKIRRIRRSRNPSDTTLRWSGYIRGGGVEAAGAGNVNPAPPQAAVDIIAQIYAGEANTSHVVFNDVANQEATINAATMETMSGFGAAAGGETQAMAAQMAFDEPLTMQQVVAIVSPFIINDAARGLP